MADAIGMDVGSYKTVLACVKARGIEIVISETSAKWTPTIAAYTDQERLIGDAAINQMKKNFKNSLQFFARYLGLNQNCKEQIEEENKFITYKVVNMDNNKIGFEVQIRGETHTFTPEQIMAYYLKKAKTYFEKAGMVSKEIVISVPSYATNSERQAYLDAAEIAGIQCVRLINESTAVALTYGFFRKSDLDPKISRKVAFVDFGHSKLSVTYASFISGKMTVLGTHSNRNLGARQIDLQLFELLGGEFAKKYGCDPRGNIRCRLRLLDSIEKVRKLLTANKEADVHCESLMEDEDLHRNIKRDDLEELVAPFIVSFRKCLEESLVVAGVDVTAIDSVELVGEATRIPCCIQQIKEVFNKDPSRTLNSTDCIARGCALQAAMLSPNFQTAAFEMEEYNAHPVAITYKQKGTEAVKTNIIFKQGTNFPSTKSVTFDNKTGGYDLMVHYADEAELMEGIPKQISQYDIGEGTKQEKTEKCSLTMRVTNNIHNVACLDEAEFVEEWTQEDKIPIKTKNIPTVPTPPAEGEKKEGEDKKEEAPVEEKPAEPEEPQFEIRQRKKKDFTKLKFTTQNFSLSPETRVMYKNLEDQLVQGDNDILESKALRNSLEAYCYEVKSNIDSYGSWEKYIEEETRKTFLAELTETVDWIYGDGETAPLAEYKKKIDKFKLIGEPVKARHYYYSELAVYYAQFDKVAENIKSKLASIEHLTDAQKETINQKQDSSDKMIAATKADKDSKKPYEDPAYTIDQVIASIEVLRRETDAIFNLPPPAATPEKKAEADSSEKKAEGAPDAEMKNEEPKKEEAK